MAIDRFGHTIDPAVRYARGAILKDPLSEFRRRTHALGKLRARITNKGRPSIYNFTGHYREYIATASDITAQLAEEWVGQSLIEDELTERARLHFGGPAGTVAAVFNRTSAAILSLVIAFARGKAVAAIAPDSDSHTSIRRAATLAGARLFEADPARCEDAIHQPDVSLVFVTRLTSDLVAVRAEHVMRIVEMAQGAGRIVVLDDAYGARLCPIALDEPASFAFNPDIALTSCDKAGLAGPRAGLALGKPNLIERALSQASEFGLEGRAPLALGVLEGLRRFDPTELSRDCQLAIRYTQLLRNAFGASRVRETVMGPVITEEDALSIALETHGLESTELVPCEATCAIAILMMEQSGYLTSNVAERPGARVSLRLRPVCADVERMGGVEIAARAVEQAVGEVRPYLLDPKAAATLILGEHLTAH